MICEGPIHHRSEALSALRVHDITVSHCLYLHLTQHPSSHMKTQKFISVIKCTGQSNNSSSRIPLDCHNLGDLCRILVVFVFYHLPLNITVTACFELNRKLHLMISDIKSVINIYTLVRKLSESWIFLLIYRGKGAADNLIFIGHHPLHLKCAQYFFKVLEIVGLIDF